MTTKQNKRSNVWNVSLWVAQSLLAAMFLMVGFMKAFTPIAELSNSVPLASEMPSLVRFIGVSELAGALGLLLPSLLRIWPHLTAIASAALGLVMALAVVFHAVRGESIVISGILFVVAAFITWGRMYKAPISPRVSRTSELMN